MRDNEEDLETLNEFMDQENDYNMSINILHFLEFLRDEVGFKVLKKKVKKPLKGLKIMPYYGCMMLRPREVATAFRASPHPRRGTPRVSSAFFSDSCKSRSLRASNMQTWRRPPV